MPDMHLAHVQASFKENAQRLEMEVPLRLHTFEHNYDPEKDPAGAQQNLHLRSTVVPAQVREPRHLSLANMRTQLIAASRRPAWMHASACFWARELL